MLILLKVKGASHTTSTESAGVRKESIQQLLTGLLISNKFRKILLDSIDLMNDITSPPFEFDYPEPSKILEEQEKVRSF
jgi:hypothetical protein